MRDGGLMHDMWLAQSVVEHCVEGLSSRRCIDCLTLLFHPVSNVPEKGGRPLSRSITCIKCIVGCETIVYCFSAQLASWWSSLISEAIHGPWLHIICSSVEMIGLISRRGISCNYWDGISAVTMINGHLTLGALACHWVSVLPVTVVFYFLYSASHAQ